MIATICGSMRFISEMLKWYKKLSLTGHLVYLPVFLNSNEHNHLDNISKDKLRQLHFKKIINSDFILVVNPAGYIGKDTRIEIDFARNNQIPVIYLEIPS